MAVTPLDAAIEAMPPQRFAVIDGAHFTALPTLLAQAGLKGQPLYLEGPDRDAVESGPFLVDAATPALLAAIRDLVRSKPAVVFWSWADGQPSLYRHLRSLTMFEVPIESDPEPVLFRLADPRALSLVLPVLSLEQLARFTGTAAQVAFAREDGAPVSLTSSSVDASRGFLRLTKDQYDTVSLSFENALAARAVMEFSPRVAAPPEQAAAQVRHAFARARHYRLEEFADIWQFIAWDVAFGAEFERRPEFAQMHDELIAADHSAALRLFYAKQEIEALYCLARAA